MRGRSLSSKPIKVAPLRRQSYSTFTLATFQALQALQRTFVVLPLQDEQLCHSVLVFCQCSFCIFGAHNVSGSSLIVLALTSESAEGQGACYFIQIFWWFTPCVLSSVHFRSCLAATNSYSLV